MGRCWEIPIKEEQKQGVNVERVGRERGERELYGEAQRGGKLYACSVAIEWKTGFREQESGGVHSEEKGWKTLWGGREQKMTSGIQPPGNDTQRK